MAVRFEPQQKLIFSRRSRNNLILSTFFCFVLWSTVRLLCSSAAVPWTFPVNQTALQSQSAGGDHDHQNAPASPSQTTKDDPTTLSPAARLATQSPPPKDFDARNQTFDIPSDIYFDPAGPRPEQVVLLTASDGGGHNNGIANIMELALQNRQEYCDAHGYTCHWVNVSRFDLGRGTHPVWKKLPAIIETFQTYPDAQWVWMLDLDAIIMSPEVDLIDRLLSHAGMQQQLMKDEPIKRTEHRTPREIDPNNVDLLIAQDHGNLNAGSFLVRRSEWSRWLLDMWTDSQIMNHVVDEQQTIIHFVRTHAVVRSHLGIVPLRMIQSWLVANEQMKWTPGDLVVHLAGCWVKQRCADNWNEMWAKRGKAPPPLATTKKQEQQQEQANRQAALWTSFFGRR